MKRILTITLATVFVLATLVPAQAAEMTFEDVASSDWYYDSVKEISSRGIIAGRSPTVFAPKAVMTRAEFVTMLTKIASVSNSELENAAKKAEIFKDVELDDWCAPYIGWGVENKIVNGYTDGTFLPNAPVSRQELAVMLVRFFDLVGFAPDGLTPLIDVFADVKDVAKWARPQLERLRLAGIVNGDENGFYNPAKYASRAECAAIAVRYCTASDSFFTDFAPNELNPTLTPGENTVGEAELTDLILSFVPNLDSYTSVTLYNSESLLETLNSSDVTSLEITLIFTRYKTSCEGNYILTVIRPGGAE